MASARYWRVRNLTIPATDYLEISEWALYNQGARIDALATLSASTAPLVALSRLVDGDVGTQCSWTKAVAGAAGFWIKWDFGVTVEITGTRFAAYDNSARYPSGFDLEWSNNDADWTPFISISGVAYPGNYTFTVFFPAYVPPCVFHSPPGPMSAPYAPSSVVVKYDKAEIRNHRSDFEGWGRIARTVKEKGSPVNMPVRRHVFCMDMLTCTVVADTWSDAVTGEYVFNDLDLTRKYTIFAYDHTQAYRAVIADNLTPEPMS